MTIPSSRITFVLAVLLAAAALVPAAQASPASLQHATSTCWLQVINDWLDNNQVDHVYAIPCYTQAIQRLSSYSDIAGYSSAIDDIRRAELAAIRQDRSDGGPGGGGSSSGGGPTSSGGGGPSSGGGDTSGGNTSGGSSKFLGIPGPSDATSIPLPLIVLGALAILLALAALGTWIARRVQSRRPGPAEPAPAVSRRR
jgi:hypothetical protein